MKFRRVYLSLRERLSALKTGIIFLAMLEIPCWHPEEQEWTMEKMCLMERLLTFYSCFDTFLCGYMYEGIMNDTENENNQGLAS